jgi:lysophospholipase L1-like esterase
MKLFSNCVLYLAFFSCCSQSKAPVVMQNPKNTILGESASLAHFFSALDALATDSCKTLSIVHIGDSHIQADYFSGMLRVLLQEKFGNAGRGLIFPYHIAHTNEPVNYSSSSLSEWKGVRNVINPNSVAIGVCGISAFSVSDNPGFSIKTRNQKGMNYAFNRVELFSKVSDPANTLLLSQSGTVVAEQKTNPFVSVFNLPDTTHHIDFQFSALNTVDIHGIVLKNDHAGIIYHSIGVNGASYKSYNSTSLLMAQLPYLKPDLIIISLGTNESYSNAFNLTEFEECVTTFLTRIKLACGPCSILLTTPSDNYKFKKGKPINNPYPQLISDYFISNAAAYHCAVWDLYEVMGGRESMKHWKKQGLATKDYVHFTKKGYELQGNLLFEAIMNRYTHR